MKSNGGKVKLFKKTSIVIMVLAAAIPSHADIISAVGAGWCNSGMCGNTNTNVVDNSYADANHNNWFAFDLPDLGEITAATLRVNNDAQDTTTSATATYVVYQATSIDYAGVIGGGVPLGSVYLLPTSGVAGLIDIVLNDAAIDLLNAARGSTIIFGGTMENVGSGSAQLAGYSAIGAELDLTVNAVPEPSTVGLGLFGLAAMIWIRRSRTSRKALETSLTQ